VAFNPFLDVEFDRLDRFDREQCGTYDKAHDHGHEERPDVVDDLQDALQSLNLSGACLYHAPWAARP
jgi:hypothetical protein